MSALQVPMIRNPTCDFSYAGLKTAVRRAVEQRAPGPATDANRQVRQLTPGKPWPSVSQDSLFPASHETCVDCRRVQTSQPASKQWL